MGAPKANPRRPARSGRRVHMARRLRSPRAIILAQSEPRGRYQHAVRAPRCAGWARASLLHSMLARNPGPTAFRPRTRGIPRERAVRRQPPGLVPGSPDTPLSAPPPSAGAHASRTAITFSSSEDSWKVRPTNFPFFALIFLFLTRRKQALAASRSRPCTAADPAASSDPAGSSTSVINAPCHSDACIHGARQQRRVRGRV